MISAGRHTNKLNEDRIIFLSKKFFVFLASGFYLLMIFPAYSQTGSMHLNSPDTITAISRIPSSNKIYKLKPGVDIPIVALELHLHYMLFRKFIIKVHLPRRKLTV